MGGAEYDSCSSRFKGRRRNVVDFRGFLANVRLAAQLGALARQADNFSSRLSRVDQAMRRI